jgi:hypothetical protein
MEIAACSTLVQQPLRIVELQFISFGEDCKDRLHAKSLKQYCLFTPILGRRFTNFEP